MKKILVLGASGFVGKRLAQAALAEGYSVRCVVRNPAKVQDLAQAGCESVQGDILDIASMQRAFEGVEAAYISIHTLSPQPSGAMGQDFMDIETQGLKNIVTACRETGAHRLVYVTFLGTAPDGMSAWIRGRWEAEQFLLKSGLDVTVIRPGQIVGFGGQGFNLMASQARKSIAMTMGSGKQKWRNIALDDLIYYLLGVLNDERANGQCYDVGCDDILTTDQMIDIVAEALGRKRPIKIHLPAPLLSALAPLIERMSKLPNGSIRGLLDSMQEDAIGDPTAIRALLPRPPLSYRKAVEQALSKEKA